MCRIAKHAHAVSQLGPTGELINGLTISFSVSHYRQFHTMSLDPQAIASSWLADYGAAFATQDLDTLTGLFLPDGWLRDLLVFTWDNRSLEGREKIKAFLHPTLSGAQVSGFKLDESAHIAPMTSVIAQIQARDVEFACSFECLRGPGRGYVRLLADADGKYRALAVLMMLSDLRGHEEIGTLHLRDEADSAGHNTQKEFADWVKEVETNPYVLIGMSHTLYSVAPSLTLHFQSVGPRLACRSLPVSNKWASRP